MLDNQNIQKLTESFFPGKFLSPQKWVKRDQNGPKRNLFDFLKNPKYC